MKTEKAMAVLALIGLLSIGSIINSAEAWDQRYPSGGWGGYQSQQSPAIYGSDGRYLGRLNNNPYDPQSVANPYGQYGSPYGNTINNPYSRYGSPYSPYGVRNPYGR